MKRILICAAEPSGDALAASLVQELRHRRSDLQFSGLTGPLMRAARVHSLASGEDATVLGVAEALGKAATAARTLWRLEKALRVWRPDLLLTVDSPSLLLRLAKRAKKRGIITVHWVSPQIWAWRPGRARRIAKSVDCLLCLFSMEPPLYRGLDVRAVFVGHPAADRVLPKRVRQKKTSTGLRIG
ncbi:MAG: lipid-A-disaccharide synthase, partial [Proteobacteria bacterium]|nr:lipid-A-disaccharide synthase [Pseudomonadota bacterium]